jgi:CIC family chloride channel protein
VIATTLCRSIEPASFYLRDLVEQGQLLRPGTDARVLSDLAIDEALEKDCISVSPDMRLGDFVGIVKQSHRNLFPVEEAQSGRFVGLVDLNDIRPYLFDPHLYDAVLLEQIMNSRPLTAAPEDDLAEVIDKMDANRLFSIPVVSNQHFIGMISKATLLDHYRRELRVQTFNE